MAYNLNYFYVATFLNGMKTAFITSIIGIIFDIVIKVIQSPDENKSPDTAQTQADTLLQNTKNILDALNSLQESARTSNALQDRTASSISTMAESNKASANISPLRRISTRQFRKWRINCRRRQKP